MILLPATAPDDWRAHLADPERHWRQGYSAFELAHRWHATAPDLPPEVAACLPEGATLRLAVPEHRTALPGAGYPSQADLFALVSLPDGLCAVTIEGKVAEPFDKTVSDWLGPAPSANRRTRLAALCARIGLSPDAASPLRYQLLHRTAAALIEADHFAAASAAMIVHSFSPDRLWAEDFRAFARALGTAPSPGNATALTAPDGRTLYLGWATGPLWPR